MDNDEVPKDTNLAVYLQNKIRVLCFVMTSESQLNTSGYIIMDTWGKRCTKTLLFSNGKPTTLGIYSAVQ